MPWSIDSVGHEVLRIEGINEDIGSTPVFVADVDGDGQNELIKNGLDLEGRNPPRRQPHLCCLGTRKTPPQDPLSHVLHRSR